MAVKPFYHDLDLVKVSQLLNARIHNITTTDRTTLGGTLNSAHKGLLVFDTDLLGFYGWSGSAWASVSASVAGAMTYKGGIAHNATEPATPATGDTYVFTSAGTCTWNSSDVVQISDSAIWNGTSWDFYQGNVVDATESVKGIVELASTAEAQAGTATNVVMTPANTKSWTDQNKFAKVYFGNTITLVANTPFTIAHNLALQNRNAFNINVMDSAHSQISVDVDSTDQNNLTITSAVALSGVSVTVTGF
jgi:hypothetical protein